MIEQKSARESVMTEWGNAAGVKFPPGTQVRLAATKTTGWQSGEVYLEVTIREIDIPIFLDGSDLRRPAARPGSAALSAWPGADGRPRNIELRYATLLVKGLRDSPSRDTSTLKVYLNENETGGDAEVYFWMKD